jgi:hypothetical protein
MVTTQFNTGADWKSRGFFMRSPPVVIACFDPAGDGSDRDALVMIAREEHQMGEPIDPNFAVQTVNRVLLVHQMSSDMEFPDKVAVMLRLHRNLSIWRRKGRSHTHVLCIETNGVGYAMGSTLREKVGKNVLTYHTVGRTSNDLPYGDKRIAMPRLPALDHLRVLAENHTLKIAKDAPGKAILEKEMASFVWRRPGRPEALEGQRDDAVMALAGACWIGSKIIPPVLKQERYSASRGPL